MQIAIKGRNVPVTDEIRKHAERHLGKVARQVSDLARVEIEIYRERNPRVTDRHVAEASARSWRARSSATATNVATAARPTRRPAVAARRPRGRRSPRSRRSERRRRGRRQPSAYTK
jgi:ribosomal subunit interface protein